MAYTIHRLGCALYLENCQERVYKSVEIAATRGFDKLCPEQLSPKQGKDGNEK